MPDVLAMPGLLAFFGAVFYLLAASAILKEGKPGKGKIFGLVVLVIALVVGALKLWELLNPNTGSFYRQLITQRRVLWAHYGAVAIPAITLVGCFIFEKVMQRVARDQDY